MTDRVDPASESDRSLSSYKSSSMNHLLQSLREIEVLSCATTQVMIWSSGGPSSIVAAAK